MAGVRAPGGVPPVTGSAVSHGFADEIRAQRQEALYQLLLAFVLALAGTLAVYLGLSLAFDTPPLESCLGRVSDVGLPWAAAVMLSRGALQPLNVCVFAFGVAVLILRLLTMRREFKAFYQPYLDGIPLNEEHQLVIGEPARGVPLQNLRSVKDQYSGTPPLLVRRIDAGSRRLAEGGDADQVHVVMQALGEIDRSALDSRYTLLRYLTWLIPTIGFLGTVIGMGQAIAGFGSVIAGFSQGTGDLMAQLQPVLSEVARNLGVAFDTTLLALLLSAILVALASIGQMREEALLSSIDEFTLRHFVSRIDVPAAGARQLGEMMQGLLMPVFQALMSQQDGRAAGGSEPGVELRDLAGALAAQTEHLRLIRDTLDRAVKRFSP